MASVVGLECELGANPEIGVPGKSRERSWIAPPDSTPVFLTVPPHFIGVHSRQFTVQALSNANLAFLGGGLGEPSFPEKKVPPVFSFPNSLPSSPGSHVP
jgi:hypothetical protein